MLFIEIEELPETERRSERDNKSMPLCLEEFMAMNTKVAWVVYEPHEYSTINSARATFSRACRRYGLPIIACVRNNDLYLVRTDM